MLNANPYLKYQQNQVKILPPEKLVVMLYDGAIKFLNIALLEMDKADHEKTNHYIGRTQDIISELMVTLNLDAGEVAHNLYTLYDYMNYRLFRANIQKDKRAVQEILEMVTDLRQAWAAISLGTQQIPLVKVPAGER